MFYVYVYRQLLSYIQGKQLRAQFFSALLFLPYDFYEEVDLVTFLL